MTPDQQTALLQACREFTGEQEGNVLWLYRDNAVAGNASVGRGHLLYSAAYAAFVFGVPLDTIQPQWDALMALPGGKEAGFYECATALRLTPEQSDSLFEADLNTHLLNCRDYVKGFDGMPQPIQVATNDIDFNVKGGIRTFPKYIAAIEAGNWSLAATESDRPQLASRSRVTKELILSVLNV